MITEIQNSHDDKPTCVITIDIYNAYAECDTYAVDWDINTIKLKS